MRGGDVAGANMPGGTTVSPVTLREPGGSAGVTWAPGATKVLEPGGTPGLTKVPGAGPIAEGPIEGPIEPGGIGKRGPIDEADGGGGGSGLKLCIEGPGGDVAGGPGICMDIEKFFGGGPDVRGTPGPAGSEAKGFGGVPAGDGP